MNAIADSIAALRAEALTYPAWVQVWMKVMGGMMALGLVAALVRRRALWIVLAMALTMLTLILGKALWPDLPRATLGEWAHIVIWPPALWALWRGHGTERAQSGPERAYAAWKLAVSAVMAASLALDLAALLR